MSFIHAYLRFDCRVQTRPKPPICTLVSKFSSSARNWPLTISDIIAPPFRNASEQQQPGDVLSPQLLRRLSVIYCASIRQQERSCFRHLKLLMSQIKERRHRCSACLLTTSTRCQNRSSPGCCQPCPCGRSAPQSYALSAGYATMRAKSVVF